MNTHRKETNLIVAIINQRIYFTTILIQVNINVHLEVTSHK